MIFLNIKIQQKIIIWYDYYNRQTLAEWQEIWIKSPILRMKQVISLKTLYT